MPGISDRTRFCTKLHLSGVLAFAAFCAGCASMTQDVDAYYRQMAFNFQEAADKAVLDEVALENESRVLGVTGDQSRYRKAQKQLKRIKNWEEHCRNEKIRFEKAAEWMEKHMHVEKTEINPIGSESASRPQPKSSSELTTSTESTGKESLSE